MPVLILIFQIKMETPRCFFAARMGHTGAIRILVDAGANLDIVDGHGSTALSWAAGGGHTERVNLLLRKKTEVVQLLVDAGANPNIPDKYGFTPLSWATYKGDSEAIQILVDAGAEEN